jgi:hypothetical protein
MKRNETTAAIAPVLTAARGPPVASPIAMDLHTDAPAPTLLALRDLVRRFRVCYEVAPELAVVGDEIRAIGFTIELSGTHDHPRHEPFAGCDACFPIANALRAILAHVVPLDFRPSQFQVHDSRMSHRFAPQRGNRPELTASVTILHREGAQRPIDECELRCRDEIVGALASLGAAEIAWRDPT